MKYTTYKGYKISHGAGNGATLPQGYHKNVYVDTDTLEIFTGDLLSQGWEEFAPEYRHIATISHPHPYFGKPSRISRDMLVTLADRAVNGEPMVGDRFNYGLYA